MSKESTSKGIDQLTSSERAALDRIVSLANIDGVITGVVIGTESWDIRPLVLEQGRLSQVRLLAPERVFEPGFAQEFCANFESLVQKQFTVDTRPKVGYQDGKLWFSRPYLKETLADGLNPFEDGVILPVSSLKNILGILLELYRRGLSHGNISLSNLAFFNNQLLLLDICMHAIPAAGSADEDLVALQKIFSLMRFEGCTPAIVSDLQRIGSLPGSPASRIDALLTKIEAVANLRSDIASSGNSVEQEAESLSLRARGKLIQSPKLGVAPVNKDRVESPVTSLSPSAIPAQRTSERFSLADLLEKRFGTRRTQLIWLGIMLGFFSIAFISGWFGSVRPSPSLTQYAKLWASESVQNQSRVLEAALKEPFSPAIDVIRAAALAEKNEQRPQNAIIRLAFDERWFSQLSAKDRRTVLSIALGELIPANLKEIAPFASLHPGVLLALAGAVSLDNSGEMFANIPWQVFKLLPEPYAAAFNVLSELGVVELRSLPARAYAHLVVGDASLHSFGNYFLPTADEKALRLQLGEIVPLFDETPSMAVSFEQFLAASGLPFQRDYGWFGADSTAQWEKASSLQRVSILAGKLPKGQLALEQLIDLLQFPQKVIRDQAVAALIKSTLPPQYQSLLIVLASDENRLTRSQNIFLVSALQVSDEEAFAFLSRWFSGEPDPDTVFLILLSRSRIPKPAPFDIEGARYLIDRQWRAATEELAELVRHPEPLARALAYSRLDPKRPADLKILKAQLKADSSERMRQQIHEKLQSAGVR